MIERHIGDFPQRPRSRKKPNKQQPSVARKYPECHFMQPVIAWFGPLWRPRWPDLVARSSSGHSIADRERQVAEGTGWAGGTLSHPNTPKTTRPGWIR